ncbi:hypothetical protein DMUE_0871 [Dictyocoela muelleri]|nr:hypothetical protein DMUE_0871 [Dictyocoela muelleri]
MSMSGFMNKNNYTKSLLDLYLNSTRSWVTAHRINLSLKQKEKKSNNDKITDIKTFSYIIKIKGTDLEIKGNIPILSNIFEQDILVWIKEFRRAVKKTGWKEEESIQILKNFVPEELFDEIETFTSLEKCIQAIHKSKYNKNTAEYYFEKFKGIKQADFIFLKDYVFEQEKALEEFLISKNYNKNIQTVKFEESFFEGLIENTTLFLSQHDIFDKKEAIKKLLNLEQALETQFDKHKISNMFQKHSQKYMVNEPKEIYTRDKNIKWCPYHKTSSHSKEDCFTLKVKNKKGDSKSRSSPINKESSNYIVFEAKPQVNF